MNGFKLGRLAAVAAIAGLLCGCAATKFDPADAGRIHTIAVAPVEEPGFELQIRFVQRTTGRDFSDVMQAQNLHLGAEVKAAIVKAVRDDGYTVTDQGAGGAADAVLSIVVGGVPPNYSGPMYESALGGFKPEYSVLVKLRDAATKSVLYDRFFVYRDNSIAPMDGSMLIRPDPKYAFTTGTPADDPALAAEGFRAPIPMIAGTVGASLKKPAQ
jgi:hypothetical protein